jgi:recombination protein U
VATKNHSNIRSDVESIHKNNKGCEKELNSGKRFEQNFRDSVPVGIFFYRFRDGTSSWGGGENSATRFQAKNICDCMMYDGNYLYLLELKSHKGASLPLSAIRESQIKNLMEADKHMNVEAGLIVNFADAEEVYYMPIEQAYKWFFNGIRKSIPIKEFRDNCIQIKGCKKKTNYVYDINKFLSEVFYGHKGCQACDGK